MTENAYDAFSKSQNLCARRRNLRNADYFAGQKILLRNFRKRNKFDVNFLKNYEIVKKLGKTCYMVKNLETNRYSKCNIRDIKADTENIQNVDTPEELRTEQNGREPNGLEPNGLEQNGLEKNGLEENGLAEQNGVENENGFLDLEPEQRRELEWEDQMRQNQEVRTRVGRLTKQPDRYGQTTEPGN